MVSTHRRSQLLALLVLVVAGVVRMPIEQALTEDLRSAQLLRPPLDLEVRKKVGQGFWAVSLGGLRTLVATILNLRAFSDFENYEWVKVADTYDTIVQLAPHTAYYWETGSWHMAYNAASYYQRNDEGLPEIRARGEWERWIRKGEAFLREGVRQNPDHAMLWTRLGWLYVDPYKIQDFDKAVEAFGEALATGEARPYVRRFQAMAMARSERYIDQALPTIRKIMAAETFTPPTLQSLRFALEHRENPDVDSERLALQIFGSHEAAYQHLGSHHLDRQSQYPQHGVAEYLRRLESLLKIPEEQSVLKPRDSTDPR
jgi:tetratricopeptide (TPR) repeat protein